jgi:hypothetical protein
MKVFVCDGEPREMDVVENFNLAKDGELMMFNPNISKNDVGMLGINTFGLSTCIKVVDLNLSFDFVVELITKAVEKHYSVLVDEKGNFTLGIKNPKSYNIFEQVKDLIKKASVFEHGTKVFNINKVVFPL